jgi:aspartyl-tRNA(Asn)/glutamyl-tRNA(Gln) amidotransferase subunit C
MIPQFAGFAKPYFKDFAMALTLADVEKIAKLSRLRLSAAECENTLAELNNIFALVEQMQAVNTEGVAPMAHPHELALRLRDDMVTETDEHQRYQQVAPQVAGGLYLVPKVIE